MKRITLRLPDDVAADMDKLAEDQDRSLNAEIIRAIKYYVEMHKRRDKYDEEFKKMKDGNYDEI